MHTPPRPPCLLRDASRTTALVIPVYIDTGVSLTILVADKLGQTCAATDDVDLTQTLDVSLPTLLIKSSVYFLLQGKKRNTSR